LKKPKHLEYTTDISQGRGFGGRNPSLLEEKAMLLMAHYNVTQLSSGKIHYGSTQS